MTTTTILILSAVISAFMLFGGVLAWGDFYSRKGSRNQPSSNLQATPHVSTSTDYREAA